MKYLITTILFLCIFYTVHAQVDDCPTCPCIIELGNKYTQKKEYEKAIDIYNAATACDINLKSEADKKIKTVFKKIEKEIDDAIAAEKRAIKAEKEIAEALRQIQISEQKAIEETNKAKIAENEAQGQKKIAEKQTLVAEEKTLIAEEKTKNLQVVLDALYFYGDSLALAYHKARQKVFGFSHGEPKEGFGFINKKGEILIDFQYEEALPFSPRGYAKVKKYGVDYIIDTKGVEYRWKDDVNKLNKDIKAFDFSGESRFKLNSVQQKIVNNRQLTVLFLDHCKIEQLPDEIGQLNRLQILDLSINKLTGVPSEIGQLKQLKKMDLTGNLLNIIPAEIGQLEQLQNLDLGVNQLSDLPSEIGQLKQLQILDLSMNKLSVLPAEIGQLKQLRILLLGQNQLSTLPLEIGQLQQLKHLHLWSNNFSSQEKQKIKMLLPNCNIQFSSLYTE